MRRVNINYGKDLDGGFTAGVVGRDKWRGSDCRTDGVGRRSVHRDDDREEGCAGTCCGCDIGRQ